MRITDFKLKPVYKKFDPEDSRTLAGRSRSGDTVARNTLIQGNTALPYRIAKEFTWSGLTIEELVAAGCLGLIRATETYNPDLGTFAGHAVPWIKNSMRDEISKKALIRLPENKKQDVYKIRVAISKIERTGTKATIEEISEETKLDTETISNLLEVTTPIASLDKPIDQYEESPLVENISGDENLEDNLESRDLVRRLCKNLSPAELKAIKNLYVEGKTITETAKELKLTTTAFSNRHKLLIKKLQKQADKLLTVKEKPMRINTAELNQLQFSRQEEILARMQELGLIAADIATRIFSCPDALGMKLRGVRALSENERQQIVSYLDQCEALRAAGKPYKKTNNIDETVLDNLRRFATNNGANEHEFNRTYNRISKGN